MIYLHLILRKGTKELVSKVYQTQKSYSLPGDYFRLVAADLKKMEIQLNDTQSTNMSAKKYI